jgi:hypothetical protein
MCCPRKDSLGEVKATGSTLCLRNQRMNRIIFALLAKQGKLLTKSTFSRGNWGKNLTRSENPSEHGQTHGHGQGHGHGHGHGHGYPNPGDSLPFKNGRTQSPIKFAIKFFGAVGFAASLPVIAVFYQQYKAGNL